LSSSNGFSQLAKLSVTGLPSGVTAGFSPQQITTGQIAILTITAPAGQPTGNATLTISPRDGGRHIDDRICQRGPAVQAASTSLIGRTVEATTLRPDPPITINFLGIDDAGHTTEVRPNAVGCRRQLRLHQPWFICWAGTGWV